MPLLPGRPPLKPDEFRHAVEHTVEVRFNSRNDKKLRFLFEPDTRTLWGTIQVISYPLRVKDHDKHWEYAAASFMLPKHNGDSVRLITTPGRQVEFSPDDGMNLKVFYFSRKLMRIKVWNANRGKAPVEVGIYLTVRKSKDSDTSHDPQVSMPPKTT